MIEFQLHERLEADSVFVGRLSLCEARLQNDRRYPWLVLIPRRPGLREIFELPPADRAALIEEIAQAGAALQALYAPDKINVGALGNLVPQLHVHVVARRRDDAAWPGPVWGVGQAEPWGSGRDAEVARLRAALGL